MLNKDIAHIAPHEDLSRICKNCVNSEDAIRPCARLLCRELPNGKIIYINKKLRKKYPKLRKSKDYETLKTYGFVEKNGKFIQKFDSKAKYDDGAIQRWQGFIVK